MCFILLKESIRLALKGYYFSSILQHFNITARAEDNVFASVDVDDFVIGTSSRTNSLVLEGYIFGQDKFVGRFRLGVCLAHNVLKSQPDCEADDRKDGQ